ncbi:MAG: MerR family transcriptional regulator [Desulfobaccales bacterium]
MAESKALRNALKEDEASRAQLFLVEEILEGYQELLEAHEFQANYSISSRTFRYWVNRGLFHAPLRRKFNQALYPARTILELLAVRILQGEFNLSLGQIRTLFESLPLNYWQGVAGIKQKQRESQFQEALILDPQSLSRAKEMLISCSGVEEEQKWMREYMGVETDEEAKEMLGDMVSALGAKLVSAEDGLHANEITESCLQQLGLSRGSSARIHRKEQELLFPYMIMGVPQKKRIIVGVFKFQSNGDFKLIDKTFVPLEKWKSMESTRMKEKDEEFFRRYRAFREKWAPALEKAENKEDLEE